MSTTTRPLVHQRQISHLALPPLLIPAPQPSSSQLRASTPPQSRSSSPAPPTHNTPIPQRTPTPTSLLKPNTRQPIAQRGSLIAFLQHQQQHQQQARTYSTSSSSKMASDEQIPEIITRTRAAASGTPGEQVEPRQTLPSEDMEPNPANSIPLPPNRQKLVDDVIALYSCQPTIERVARYAPGQSGLLLQYVLALTVYSVCLRRSVRIRQWSVHASQDCHLDPPLMMTDRYKMAGQWFGLPKLFPKSENLGYEIVKNDDTLIQFKNKQVSRGLHPHTIEERPNIT